MKTKNNVKISKFCFPAYSDSNLDFFINSKAIFAFWILKSLSADKGLRDTKSWFLLIFLGFIWGFSFLAVSISLEAFTPMQVAAFRITLGALGRLWPFGTLLGSVLVCFWDPVWVTSSRAFWSHVGSLGTPLDLSRVGSPGTPEASCSHFHHWSQARIC